MSELINVSYDTMIPNNVGLSSDRRVLKALEKWHPGYIDWETYEANQTRLGQNTRPRPHQGGGAVREGSALLQGLATCGHCGRRLRTHYSGNNASPG